MLVMVGTEGTGSGKKKIRLSRNDQDEVKLSTAKITHRKIRIF